MKVMIDGYFYKNAGDDLFLKTILDNFNKQDMEIYVVGNDENLDYFNRNYKVKTVDLKKAILLAPLIDVYVNVGGSIFIEKKGWWKLFMKRLYFFGFQKVKSKPGYIIGANFGPYKSQFFLKLYKIFIEIFVTKMTVRDQHSLKILNSNKIEIFEDLVLSLDNFDAKNRVFKEKDNVMGYSLVNPSIKSEAKLNIKDFETDITNKIKNDLKQNKIVKLFSFCEGEGDVEFINKLMLNFTEEELKNIKVVLYNGNLEAFLKEFREINLLIGARFHSIILAINYGIPFIPIVYSDKTLNYLNGIIPVEDKNYYSMYAPNHLALYTDKYLKIDDNLLIELKNSSRGHLKQIYIGEFG